MSRYRIVAVVISASLSAAAQDGLYLGAPMSTPAGDGPTAIAAGDVDLDGNMDLVVAAGFGTDTAASLLGDGSGAFPGIATFQAGVGPTNLALADISGDGVLEAAFTSSPDLMLLENIGAGAFGFAQPLLPSADVSFADLNVDGQLDLIWCDSELGTAGCIFFEAALGEPAFFKGPAGVNPLDVAWADVDSDGDDDLLAAGHDDDSVTIQYAPVAPLSKPLLKVAVGDGPRSVAVADINGDGQMDILTSDDFGHSVSVVYASGPGYSVPESYPAGESPSDVAVEDLDGDGERDVLVLSTDSAAHTFLLVFEIGAGGGLLPPIPVPLGTTGAARLALADFDGDDRLDVAAAVPQDDVVVAILNAAAWWNHGGGSAPSGAVPSLVGSGTLAPNAATTLSLTDALASSPAILVVGLTRHFQPLKGGTLVPSPDVVVPGLLTDAAGDLLLEGRWPSGLAVGTQLTFQIWTVGPSGYSISDGVSAEQP